MALPLYDQLKPQLDKCRYFGGVYNRADGSRIPLLSGEKGTCRAGVTYPDGKLPCFREGQDRPCDKREMLSPEELHSVTLERVEQIIGSHIRTGKRLTRFASTV